MDELISCAGCCCNGNKSEMHYDPITKLGETRARYYCDACWDRKAKFTVLKNAQRTFRNTTTVTPRQSRRYY